MQIALQSVNFFQKICRFNELSTLNITMIFPSPWCLKIEPDHDSEEILDFVVSYKFDSPEKVCILLSFMYLNRAGGWRTDPVDFDIFSSGNDFHHYHYYYHYFPPGE